MEVEANEAYFPFAHSHLDTSSSFLILSLLTPSTLGQSTLVVPRYLHGLFPGDNAAQVR